MYRNRNSAPRGAGILNALQAMQMEETKSKLPAEILVAILDYLPVADQMRMARVSRRLQEMVYDDTRWVSRLRNMGCWKEEEARRRFGESMRRRREAAGRLANPEGGNKHAEATLFDATAEEEARRQRAASDTRDGFETMSLEGGAPKDGDAEADSYLDVLDRVKSIRGGARHEYGKTYAALAPFYFDLVRARNHTEPIVFKAFRDPERQAKMLANLRRFAKSDTWMGCWDREQKLASMVSVFENAVLREFEQGYEAGDVQGKMKRYAHVLHTLGSARVGTDLYIHKHAIFHDAELVARPAECFSQAPAEEISLEPSRRFFETLLAKVNQESSTMEAIFTEPTAVFWDFVDKVREDLIMEYTTPLLDEAHERSVAAYVKAVSGVFEQSMRFYRALRAPGARGKGDEGEEKLGVEQKAKELGLHTFEPHLDLYLQEELDLFTKQAEAEVSEWEKKLSEHDSSVESFYMSNINRSADKKDFLSSFKKVVMMPVAMGSAFAPAKTGVSSQSLTPTPSRPGTPGLSGRSSPLASKAPTDELAAKAAIMASKLEGIKSLCSIEVALKLVHAAKTSLGRAAVLIPLGGQVGGEAREQCANMFVVLLRILGQRHVHAGFERAVGHLAQYKPREASSHAEGRVAPLVTFIELVNVGDLISQMVDVFYQEQVAGAGIADKKDFLDAASLAKKKFEQMLDEKVAAGLNKGIDVLMDEVEWLQATTQLPTDYNPPSAANASLGPAASASAAAAAAAAAMHSSSSSSLSSSSSPASQQPAASALNADIGPTQTTRRIIALVSSHTNMLVGTTDKAMLDVFNAEVGTRLFASICKHVKRQRISTAGAVALIADFNLYAHFVRSLRNQDLLAYFAALRELGQIFLIDAAAHARDMAAVIADADRFGGVFRAEEVYEYAQRRADWYQVRKGVERAMYGIECLVM
ncbi:hypothetical protein CDD81_3775 [Ophiocordyceps australis]|uniref:F-box domain-containing protein n=1 Tax=Ophiocordyceps australis TaxID=1399860 RepID=A0A2C5XJI8_9HYPO|nr:hypothetical protein CDD81_3775 [Ophiocordyceps australis]